MKEHVIKAEGIVKRYGSITALSHVDITVDRGDIYGLIGDNGAGKTTFLKLLCGQIYPDSGELSLLGASNEREREKVRQRTGAIVEHPGFYQNLTVEQNLEYYRIQRGIPGKQKVQETLERVGMAMYRKKKGKNLSMGMKQRLGLGIALLGEPELLILDEPINGLDPSGMKEMRNLLLELNREKGITIIVSSHILPELEQIATAYGFLGRGLVLEQISAEQLKEACEEYVSIQVQDAERYAALLEQKLHIREYQVYPDGKVRIRSGNIPMEAYGALAAQNGIGIFELKRRHMTLEEYYLELKKRGVQS